MVKSRVGNAGVVDRILGRTLMTAFVFALAAVVAFPAVGGANVKLWLYPEGAGPRNGGYVVKEGAFTLVVENVGTAQDTAQMVTLVIALNDPALLTSGTITLPDGEVDLATAAFESGVPSMPCTGKTIPPHGIYPTSYLEVPLDDLPGGGLWQIPVNVSGEAHLEMHFDATAEGFKQTGHGEVCYDVVNPSGHDVTLALGAEEEPSCPDIAISKSASTTGVAPGEEVSYTIQATNQGDCELTDVVITDSIPTVDDDDGNLVPAFSVVATDPAPSSQDAGSLTWALGAPLAPGESTTVTVTAAFDVAADGLVVVNTACVATAQSEETECDDAKVAVGQAPGEPDQVTGAGFWCNRIRLALAGGPGATYSVENLQALLDLVDEQSAVFSELVDATTTPELAQSLLCTPRNIPMADKLARQLLALWLNVVSERLDPALTLADLCAGEEALPPGTEATLSVADVIAGAEDALLAGAERAALVSWMELVDFINNASVGEECGAGGVGVVTETAVRHGHGRRHSPK